MGWARHVVIHPEGNVDVAAGVERYRSFLADQSTFASLTLEDLVASHGLPRATEVAVRRRYLA